MMKTVMTMNKTINLLKENDNFLILTHKKPDGDTAGSASALCQILRLIGKTAYIAYNCDITPRYESLIADFYPSNDYKPSFVISTDVAAIDLLTDDGKKYQNDIDLCIDHHVLSNKGFAKHNLLVDYGACGEIIFDIAKDLDIKLNENLAKALYISISTDTGCFKYSNTTAHTHMAAAECVGLINSGAINRELFDMKSQARLAIEKRILNNLDFYFDQKVAIIAITLKDRQETNATQDDLDSIAALPRSIEGVEIAITLFEQKDGSVKASVRSSGDVSASEICAVYNGGGHLRAAGCTMHEISIEQASKNMIEATKKVGKYV